MKTNKKAVELSFNLLAMMILSIEVIIVMIAFFYTSYTPNDLISSGNNIIDNAINTSTKWDLMKKLPN